jgi:hypothetical protein
MVPVVEGKAGVECNEPPDRVIHYHQIIRSVKYVLQSRDLILNMLVQFPGRDCRDVGFEVVEC